MTRDTYMRPGYPGAYCAPHSLCGAQGNLPCTPAPPITTITTHPTYPAVLALLAPIVPNLLVSFTNLTEVQVANLNRERYVGLYALQRTRAAASSRGVPSPRVLWEAHNLPLLPQYPI